MQKVIKTAVGTFLAIYLAEKFQIKYGVTAGIVAIISIQTTKRESLKIAGERVAASFIGLLLAALFFYFGGYNPLIFGIFVLVFMPLCLKFNIFQGFLVTVVLAAHMLTEKSVSLAMLLNEGAILFIGAAVAIGLNMYMPNLTGKIKELQNDIDELMKRLLNDMGDVLLTGAVQIDEEKLFTQLREKLEKGRELAFNEYNNSLLSPSQNHIELFNLKRSQYKVLVRMRRHFFKLFISSAHTEMIADFTKKVGNSIGTDTLYMEALDELGKLKETFRQMPLPQSRVEFESRAGLLQFFNDLEEFLELKKDFLKKYKLN